MHVIGIPHSSVIHEQTEFFTPDFKQSAIKVGIFVAKVFAKIADFVTNIFPPIGLCKLYNYCYNKSLNEEINQAQLKSYREALTKYAENNQCNLIEQINSKLLSIDSTKELIINEEIPKGELRKDEFIEFNSKFTDILKKIILSNYEGLDIQAEDISNAIKDIVKSRVYQAFKCDQKKPSIQILKHLGYAGTTADGTQAIKNYGKKVREDAAGTDQATNEFANRSNEMNSKWFCFNRNGLISKFWYALNHPQTLVHLGTSNFAPLEFEAEKGNLPFRAGTINVPGIERPIPLTFGPTPTDPTYFDAHLRYLQDNNKTEVRFILQSTNKSEGKRVAEFYKKTEEFRKSGALSLITLPFDIQPMKDPIGFMNKDFFNTSFSIDGFMSQYANFIKEKCRKETFGEDVIVPIIPINILSDKDLQSCFDFTKHVFNNIIDASQTKKFSKEKKIELIKSMQLFTQSMMVVTALSNISNQTLSNISNQKKEISSLSIACKQCVDRAVALISAVVLLNEISYPRDPNSQSTSSNDSMTDFKNRIIGGINSPPNLSGDTSDFIHGVVMGRAQIVDQRLIMANRFKILMDFMRILFNGKKKIPPINERETDSRSSSYTINNEI